MRRLQATILGGLWWTALTVGGCQWFDKADRGDFNSEEPSLRIAAVKQAGATKDEKAVPHLVERLTDSEGDVRFFAYLALEKITGQTMGYTYYDRPDSGANLEAVRRWRQWLKDRRSPTTASQPKGVGAT